MEHNTEQNKTILNKQVNMEKVAYTKLNAQTAY
jgi:hypothetical protein